MLENGLAGLRTKDLVRRAGVSERTVFNHFDSIEDTALTRIEEYLTPPVLRPGRPRGHPRGGASHGRP